MIDFFANVLLVAAGFSIVWSGWSMYCNNRTYKDRLYLLDCIKYSDVQDFNKRMQMYDQFNIVTYDDHHRELFWRRDPWKLYAPFVRELVK